jgi:hypothetical protein
MDFKLLRFFDVLIGHSHRSDAEFFSEEEVADAASVLCFEVFSFEFEDFRRGAFDAEFSFIFDESFSFGFSEETFFI